MASDAVIGMDQQAGGQAGSLAQMFVAADSAIERRRTENIFKQLDERSLTAEEEQIIQQRVELQRKLLDEYEKREHKRKVSELQDMWPELSEAAAARALELCNGKEEEAGLRLTEDAAFKRRVMQETGTHTPSTIVVAGKPSRNRGASTGSSRSTTTRIISPSQMGGRVFVGRFRSKLGPYQVMDPALQAALPASVPGDQSASPAAAAAAAAAPLQQPKKRGRKRKSELEAAGTSSFPAEEAAAAAAAATAAAFPAKASATAEAAAQSPEVAEALAIAAALSAGQDAAETPDAAAAAGSSLPSSKRQRSSSPSLEGAEAVDDTDAATETEPDTAAAGTGACTDSGVDTDTGLQTARQHDQAGRQQLLHTDMVISMMARQVARLEPLVAAGRLLEFEARRPGCSPVVLELLGVEYGSKVSVPIATAWEVLLEEQKLNATLGLHTAIVVSTAAAAAAAAAPPAETSSRAGQSSAAPDEQHTAACASVSSPHRHSIRQQEQVGPGHDLSEQQQPQQVLPQVRAPEQQQQHQSGVQPGKAAAAHSDASTVSESPAAFGGAAAAAAAAGGTPTSMLAGPSTAAASEPSGDVDDSSRRGRGRRAAAVAAAAVSAAAAAEAGSSKAKGKGKGGSSKGAGSGGGGGGGNRASRAISETGHTCRGRVRQKSHKTTELVEVGQLVVHKDWYNAGYIFPAGFKSRLLFRSSVDTDALCLHECEIVGEGGNFWPAPTFKVTARDREDEPVVAKSCTGCWSQILKRINATISQRIAAGENLPPPPRTAIAGPEYFGLNDLSTQAAIEALDPDNLCSTYWEGKRQREAASAGLPIAVQPLARGANSSGGSSRAGGRKRGRPRASDVADADDEAEEAGYKGNHWSAISRRERYLKRCTDAGDEMPEDADQNLLPGVLDPVTLEPVVNPAMSPAGHVMGLATWKAVLAETGRCPFTKAPLRPDMLTVLTVNNIEKHRSRIVAIS